MRIGTSNKNKTVTIRLDHIPAPRLVERQHEEGGLLRTRT